MPELPEVETVKNILKLDIINKKIIKVEVFYDKIIKNVDKEEFINSLKDQTFLDISRFGKYLIFELNDYYLLGHMRMEGKYFLMHDEEISKHDHIIFYFKDCNLRYNDIRKFGTMHLFKKSEYKYEDLFGIDPLNKMGKEPYNISKEELYGYIKSSTRPIKSLLLDQSIISGLGNIYVDEVLYLSKIHPETISKHLDINDADNIIKNAVSVLNKAISLGGTTIHSFQSSHGITGRFQNELLVHTKDKCMICGNKIDKIRVGGRGTYYCSTCQKIK